MIKTFEKGDRVAWSHVIGPKHADGNIAPSASVLADDKDAQLGTIVGPDADVKGWWTVELDGEGDAADRTRVLTSDELVKVVEAPPAKADDVGGADRAKKTTQEGGDDR